MWKLVIEDDEGKRTVVPLSRDDYTIGRQEGNTIRLTERNVSRKHGRVLRQHAANGAASFVIEDLRSYNGVFVNGLRVSHSQDLQHGDLIQIGDYRIVLHDDSVGATDASAAEVADVKATLPLAPYRGQTLTERPNRLVMLVGPTPGVEYPLDRERMTIGRAEEATISVNHNSVSRLHCEVHSLGDGRFEIVDKGSSNGLRVNAVELRRSIIEAGDVIELGDVRFRFVAAGQVFVAGPHESQQLTAITDREAELVSSRKGLSGYVVPVLGAGLLGAAIIVGFVHFARDRSAGGPPVSLPEPEQAVLADARAGCTLDDCEQSRSLIATFPEGSAWRDHDDYRFIMSTWAESLLRRARADANTDRRNATLGRILTDPRVDPAQKKEASELLASRDLPTSTPTELPTVATKAASAEPEEEPPPPAAAPPPRPRATPGAQPTAANAKPKPSTQAPSTAAPAAAPASPRPGTAGYESTPEFKEALAKAERAGMEGKPRVVRAQLEPHVRTGRASSYPVRLVDSACKAMGDKACREELRQKYPSLP